MKQLKGKLLSRFAESFFLVGFTILILDFFWTIACGLRFGLLYPNSIMQLVAASLRDLVGALFCYIFISKYVEKPARNTWILLGINTVFLVCWFGFSPNPAFTDWTFALRKNYPGFVVAQSFFVSHIIGKTIAALIYYSWILKTSTFKHLPLPI